MNQRSKNRGLASLNTDGINFGDKGLNIGISKEVSEDAVSFVDSIWGSKQAAGKTQDLRLEKFKAEREKQHAMDSMMRQPTMSNQLTSEKDISRSVL